MLKIADDFEADADDAMGPKSLEKSERVNLGLALLSLAARPGVPLTLEDIAAWCGCHKNAIYLIEQNALKKLRKSPALKILLNDIYRR